MCSDTKSENSTDDDSEVTIEEKSEYQPLKNSEKKANNYLKKIVAQSLVTGAVMLSSASCGMPVGYSAILLPQLKDANTSMQIDDEIGSWIASIHSAATPLGSLASGLLMDSCGRKLALQIASLPLLLGWALIGCSSNHSMLLIGRLVAGISSGLTAAAGQVLIGEVTEPQFRGMFSSVPFASYSFGILLVYALGSVLSWRYVAALSAILPFLSILAFFFLPESPVWLVRNGQFDQARKSLLWLRGNDKLQARQETEHLIAHIEKELVNDEKNNSQNMLQMFLQKEMLKPFILINIFNILQIFSGTYLIVFYAVDILSHVQDNVHHFLVAVFTACVRFVFSIIASILLAMVGRRTLAISSGLGTLISALCLGTLLHQNCQSNDYAAPILLLIYVASNTVGFMILPGVMLAELFPAKTRGLAGGVTFMIFNFVLFGVAKIFPLVKNLIGVFGVFWIFGIAALIATIFLYLLMPETKGKSLSQIEDYFQQDNIFWVNRNKHFKVDLQNQETERLAV